VEEKNGTQTLHEDIHDVWNSLSAIDDNEQNMPSINPFTNGDSHELLCEEDLPFIRYKLPPEEETPETIRTSELRWFFYNLNASYPAPLQSKPGLWTYQTRG